MFCCLFCYRECELWCGTSEAMINVFSIQDTVVTTKQSLYHSETMINPDYNVQILCSSKKFMYSYVSPGCTLYQWSCETKTLLNSLDCSKLVPCSESLNSISIEEHVSPGKYQVFTHSLGLIRKYCDDMG